MRLPRFRIPTAAVAVSVCAAVSGAVSGCGGGYKPPGSSSTAGSPVPVQVSSAGVLPGACSNASPSGATETYTAGSGIQPQVAAIPGGAVFGVWEQERWSGLGARAIMSSSSGDSGATWSTPSVLAFSACGGGSGPGSTLDRASDPWITYAGSGAVVASALGFSANAAPAGGNGASAVLVSRYSTTSGSWSAPVAVIEDRNTSGSTPLFFNDRDSVTADPATGRVYLVWDRISSTDGSAPAWLAISSDGGMTWPTIVPNAARVLYDPGAGNEAFNNQVVVLPSTGEVLDFFTLVAATGATTLQVIRSTDQGVTWPAGPNGATSIATITSRGTANPIGGGPAIRDSWIMAQVAVDPAGGNVAVVWQQSFNGSFDGIALALSSDNGHTWSTTPKQINGSISVAAFSPTVRYLPNSVLAVTYYDLRDYASGSSVLNTDAWLTESADSGTMAGTTWHELRLQSPFDLTKAPQTNNNRPFGISPALFLGDNQGLAAVSGNPLPLYAATNSGGARAYAMQSPNPLTSSAAHVYTAAHARRPAAAGAGPGAAVQATRPQMAGGAPQ